MLFYIHGYKKTYQSKIKMYNIFTLNCPWNEGWKCNSSLFCGFSTWVLPERLVTTSTTRLIHRQFPRQTYWPMKFEVSWRRVGIASLTMIESEVYTVIHGTDRQTWSTHKYGEWTISSLLTVYQAKVRRNDRNKIKSVKRRFWATMHQKQQTLQLTDNFFFKIITFI